MQLVKNVVLAMASVAAFLALMEVSLAAFGVTPVLYESDPLVGFSSRIPLYVPTESGFVHTARNKRAYFNYQRFKPEKPPGVFRVICVGGSTTYGRPYLEKTSFCGWLRVLLRIADPSRKWHVVNAGGISYASYRVAALMEELVEYDPDLFLIYSGHNEFLETRSYEELRSSSRLLLDARAILNRTRTYTALKGVINSLSGRTDAQFMKKDVLPGEVDAVLDDSAGLDAYQRDDALKADVLTHYRINIGRMIEIADSVAARSVLVTPASNLRSCSPFKSERTAGLEPRERLAWDDWMRKARDRFGHGRLDAAIVAVDEAIAIDSRHAGGHYLRGQILSAASRYSEARSAFQAAIDEDVCPLRAASETIEIVRAVAAERGVPLVRWAHYLETRAESGIAGDDLFLDHVHLTIDANRLLATLIIEKMEEVDLLDFAPSWNQAAIQRVTQRVKSRVDPMQHARALGNLAKVFGWAGKHKEARELALRALETVDDPETHYNAGTSSMRLGMVEEAIGHFREVLQREPAHARALSDLGFALSKLERNDAAVASLRASIEIDPNQARPRFVLARTLFVEGQFDEAFSQLRAAIRINPRAGEFHMLLGDFFADRGQADAAIAEYDRALELDPGLSRASYRRALLRGS